MAPLTSVPAVTTAAEVDSWLTVPDCAVIWLHGQGHAEHYWRETLDCLKLPEAAGNCRWVFPRSLKSACTSRTGARRFIQPRCAAAPRHVAENAGDAAATDPCWAPTSGVGAGRWSFETPEASEACGPTEESQAGATTLQWFDTPEFPVSRVVREVPDRQRFGEDPQQISAAVQRIHEVISLLEEEGVRPERIAIGGFGQGAVLALHAVLGFPRRLAGCAMLCGWAACFEQLAEGRSADKTSDSFVSADILWVHGAQDAVVEPEVASADSARLRSLGVNVEFTLLPTCGHELHEDALQALQGWLSKRLV